MTLKAGQDPQVTIATDVSRHVSGIYSDNNGTPSSFSFLATASGCTGMEWQDGCLQILKSAAQLILGHTCGFGDTVMWCGANVGATNSTKVGTRASGATSGWTPKANRFSLQSNRYFRSQHRPSLGEVSMSMSMSIAVELSPARKLDPGILRGLRENQPQGDH